MKRYFYLIAAIAGLLMAASCQKEDFSVADGDYAEVSFTADLPGVATKAIADGQTVNKLYYEVYAAEDADGNVAAEAQAVVDGTAEISAGNATVNVRLVKNKKYTVFFWAQYEETGYTSPYTWTDLRNITVSYAGAVANDEKRDAFYAVEKAVSFSSAATEKVTLPQLALVSEDGEIGMVTHSLSGASCAHSGYILSLWFSHQSWASECSWQLVHRWYLFIGIKMLNANKSMFSNECYAVSFLKL